MSRVQYANNCVLTIIGVLWVFVLAFSISVASQSPLEDTGICAGKAKQARIEARRRSGEELRKAGKLKPIPCEVGPLVPTVVKPILFSPPVEIADLGYALGSVKVLRLIDNGNYVYIIVDIEGRAGICVK